MINDRDESDPCSVVRCGDGYQVRLRPGRSPREGDCKDCRYLRGYVGWWCTSDQAQAAHGTALPGRTDCPYWSDPLPMKPPQEGTTGQPRTSWWQRMFRAFSKDPT
jgi:hypothetical protein